MSRGPAPGELLRAVADPTRLRLVGLLLAEKEICVCDLCAALREVQPKVSRHLALLRRIGLVEVRSDGRWKHYALAAPSSPLHRALLRCVRAAVDESERCAGDRARLRGLELRRRCT
jgi:ArsR family transcriptional regulator